MKKIPMRQCVGCGEMKDKRELIRIIRTAEGDITIDRTGKKNGRGAYLCDDRACLEKAVKTKGLDRSFKEKISPQVYSSIVELFDSAQPGGDGNAT